MINKVKLYICILTIAPLQLIAQNNDDSLLKQISKIDIELNAPVEAEENLFLNTVSFQSFYDVLSPMGEWIQVTKEDVDEDLTAGEGQSYSSLAQDEELLFIWKPTADVNWKPYMNGKWVYTNHGWLWQSFDPWGNATYNYGRWWNSKKLGWVWMPGYAWAPAWVRWKVSADYVGWVPLNPKAKWTSEKGINSARNQAYQHSQMSEWPKYVSEGSGVDGSDSLFFPEGGTYYIAARNKFGGPPKIGELYGRYDDGTIEPSAVYVKDGEILKNVNITMHKIW